MPYTKHISKTPMKGSLTALKRGNEWVTIQDIDDEDCLWLYGEGVVGNDRLVCPISVKQSQIKAHLNNGWIDQLTTN